MRAAIPNLAIIVFLVKLNGNYIRIDAIVINAYDIFVSWEEIN
jgi:hypothetical protein